MQSFRESHNWQQRNEEKIFQGICWPWRRVSDFEFIINHSWRGREKNSRGNIPGEQIQTSLAHGQSRSTWIVVSGLLHLGQLALTSNQENNKYCWVGNQSCIDFQLNTCSFFGHGSFHIHSHKEGFVGRAACWQRNLEADLTKQMPLSWPQTNASETWESYAQVVLK